LFKQNDITEEVSILFLLIHTFLSIFAKVYWWNVYYL